MRPNVLLIVLDAARRDAFEPYGAAAGSTPAIAQLARRGTALRDVYSTACWTVPSHSSIFTGLMPRAAGLGQVRSPAEAHPILRAHRDRMLPEVLRRHGYRSVAASANLWVSPASGFDTGFDLFEQVDTGRHARMQEASHREHVRWLAEGARGRADDGAAEVEKVLERWLVSSPEPFFCFVNLLECHSPYLPPRPYGRISLTERLRAAEDARRHHTLDAIWRTNAGLARVPPDALDRARRMYGAAIAYMDDWLARMLDRLDSARLLDDTLVIVTSDHGENLGEGGRIAHALSLDDRLIHVPFVAAGPGCGGNLSSLASLPRYVAEAAGVQGHPYDDEPPADCGVAQFDPPVDRDDEQLIEKLRHAGLGGALEALTTPLTCAVADGVKVLRRGDREEVYDLVRDPLELEPVEPAMVATERLTALRSALEHPAVTSRRAVDVSSTTANAAVSAAEMRDLEERMKLLGYL